VLIAIAACSAQPLQAAAQGRIRAKQSTAEARQQQSEAGARTDPIEFVVGNVEYLLVHEIAHLLISEKGIPIIGPVENAADYIATMALLREEPLDPTQSDRAERFLLAAAMAFSASWEAGTSKGAEIPYWGEHALSIQRYYQIGCLLYGHDPAQFARVPRAFGFSNERAQGCVTEYARASRAIDWVLQTYGRRPGDGPGAESEIVYEKAPTRVSTSVVQRLRSIELLERLIARLHERFTLDRPFRLVMRSCGRPEAAWMPDRRELAICYELIDMLYRLGLRARLPPALDDARILDRR
jgi:hypothetical protein